MSDKFEKNCYKINLTFIKILNVLPFCIIFLPKTILNAVYLIKNLIKLLAAEFITMKSD